MDSNTNQISVLDTHVIIIIVVGTVWGCPTAAVEITPELAAAQTTAVKENNFK